MNNGIIKKALVSEKSFRQSGEGKFTFLVSPKTDKFEIAALVKELFDVTVLGVTTANFKGKIKKTKKGEGKRSNFKKAIVTIKKGEKIDLFDVEQDDEKGKAKSEKGKEKFGSVKDLGQKSQNAEGKKSTVRKVIP